MNVDIDDIPETVPVSESQGRYLCAILYQLLDKDDPVKTSELAGKLGVSNASVTEKIEGFADADLVTYEPYYGVELTKQGEVIARQLFWRQCTVMDLFEDMIGTTVDPDQAYKVGYTLSTETIHAISNNVDQHCSQLCDAATQEECELVIPTES
ncbi:metal-dependent transcriptional regulator [Salinarchaeum sp. IM2453]|uniref:metal-dependent transcriptional regulator n=1 Tax=Salinarchaeum sp. IM2453 TaxID=2862870 RepID=UPI001C83C976|nr:metal-dependent transcriptional regulator [Salinarchaeum sp. IM2453]QZA87900.1 metal-dependent transcriptional regulator [Salinarchaeum sp. IM2453]